MSETVLAKVKATGSRTRISTEELEKNPAKYEVEEDQGCEGMSVPDAVAAREAAAE